MIVRCRDCNEEFEADKGYHLGDIDGKGVYICPVCFQKKSNSAWAWKKMFETAIENWQKGIDAGGDSAIYKEPYSIPSQIKSMSEANNKLKRMANDNHMEICGMCHFFNGASMCPSGKCRLTDKQHDRLDICSERKFIYDEVTERYVFASSIAKKDGYTDCDKCIYKRSDDELLTKGKDGIGVLHPLCSLNLRASRPICPLFDDGKEVKK